MSRAATAQPAAAPAVKPPAAIPDAWRLLVVDVESALDAATHLTRLAEWIEAARLACDTIASMAGRIPAFDAQMRDASVALGEVEWGEDESQGLVYLHHTLQGHLRAASKAAAQAAEGCRAGRPS